MLSEEGDEQLNMVPIVPGVKDESYMRMRNGIIIAG
jgi:hypothetical protein